MIDEWFIFRKFNEFCKITILNKMKIMYTLKIQSQAL